jgi:hypothetical protein
MRLRTWLRGNVQIVDRFGRLSEATISGYIDSVGLKNKSHLML